MPRNVNFFHQHTPACARRVSQILILLVLVSTALPFHYHLHHDHGTHAATADRATHEHVAHVHLSIDFAGDAHHGDSHALDPAPDLVKGNGAQLPLFAILPALFILLPPATRLLHLAPLAFAQPLPRFTRHNTPPLRAPPRA
ncbi:MAG: hypothetical protein WCZ87_11615 [Thiohalobacteraceae bacterium]